MSPTPADRRRAAALQRALERYEALLSDGRSPDEARLEVASGLGASRRAFEVAVGLREHPQLRSVEPDPAFVGAVAHKLRSADLEGADVVPLDPAARRRSRGPGLAPLAAAACIALFAALLVPALGSLPGDRLYGLKGFSEDARLLFAAGATEARVRVDLADERFSEVEELIERASLLRAARATHAMADGEILLAAQLPPDLIVDPELSRLIESALDEAGRHLEEAADILTRAPASREDLDELVTVSRRGHRLATEVADDLPNSEQPPVLSTVVKLAKIEAAAKAARTKARPKTTPGPCTTPSPTPSATPTPTRSPAVTPAPTPQQQPGQEPGGSELTPPPTEPPADPASGTAVQSSAPATPTPTPSSTPCISPEPTPTQVPTPSPTPRATAEGSEPAAASDVDTSEGVDDADGGDGTGMHTADGPAHSPEPASA